MAQEEIAHWIERQKIIDVCYRYSRACDRLDRDLLERCYWPDGSDDHGIFRGSAPEYVDWVMDFLGKWTSSHHSNSNFLIEIEGDRAYGECHWTGYYRFDVEGVPTDQLSAGRYLDVFERRDGEWRILHRTCTSEWGRTMPVEGRDWRADPGPAIVGRRDGDDPLYRLREQWGVTASPKQSVTPD